MLLDVDGTSLDGRKAGEVMEELGKMAYTVGIARPPPPKDEMDELPVDDHAGWLHVTRAKLLFVGGLTASGPSRKCWANLSMIDGTITLYEEVVRGSKREVVTLPLEGCVCKAPPSSKKVSIRAKAVFTLTVTLT